MGGGIYGGFGNTKGTHRDSIQSLKKRSPIHIPDSATVKRQQKTGYSQVKFTWKKNDYDYESRWHTQTPNAPKGTGATWVIERRLKGIGSGKNARPSKKEVLVQKSGWVSKKEWQAAIRAKKQGILTDEQRRLLNNGHWKDGK